MLSLIRRFCTDDQGATATEYAVLLILIAFLITLGAKVIGANLSLLFSKVGRTIGAGTANIRF